MRQSSFFSILGSTKRSKKEKKGGHTLYSITGGKQKETRYLLPPRPRHRAGLSFLALRIFFSSYSTGKQILPVETSVLTRTNTFFLFFTDLALVILGGESYYRILFRISSLPSLYVPISSNEYRGYQPVL